ncbi:MAG: hypothetical protein ACI9BW_004387 [Gammaproteobacteria bacterium]|jgi:hypothetical protein
MFEALRSAEVASASTVDGEGRTCLHFAAERGDLDWLSMLLELGVDPNAQLEYKLRSLYHAIKNSQSSVAILLLGVGASAHRSATLLEFLPALSVEQFDAIVVHEPLRAMEQWKATREFAREAVQCKTENIRRLLKAGLPFAARYTCIPALSK